MKKMVRVTGAARSIERNTIAGLNRCSDDNLLLVDGLQMEAKWRNLKDSACAYAESDLSRQEVA